MSPFRGGSLPYTFSTKDLFSFEHRQAEILTVFLQYSISPVPLSAKSFFYQPHSYRQWAVAVKHDQHLDFHMLGCLYIMSHSASHSVPEGGTAH